MDLVWKLWFFLVWFCSLNWTYERLSFGIHQIFGLSLWIFLLFWLTSFELFFIIFPFLVFLFLFFLLFFLLFLLLSRHHTKYIIIKQSSCLIIFPDVFPTIYLLNIFNLYIIKISFRYLSCFHYLYIYSIHYHHSFASFRSLRLILIDILAPFNF